MTDRVSKRFPRAGWFLVLLLAMLLMGLGTFGLPTGATDQSLADKDGDSLSDRHEGLLGTSLSDPDTDADGLFDGWEVAGAVPAGAASDRQAAPVRIAGADPLRKDIFVEVDWMRDASHSHEFRRAARDRVEDAFTRAPVANPSGETGINIHIDAGELGGGGDEIEHQTLLPLSTGFLSLDGVGDGGQGAAITVGNIDSRARQELLLLAYDNPAGANTFRYRIGWNIDRDGVPSSQDVVIDKPWSDPIHVPGVGDEGQGAGARLIDLDGSGRPELVVMAYDNPPGANTFRYKIGWNLNTSGIASSWSAPVSVQGVGNEAQGAGLTFADLDGNQVPDMILMAYDNPVGPNSFRYRIGWNVNAAGHAASWSAWTEVGGVGDEAQGADVDVVDLDGNGRLELILMAYDNPPGANAYRYRIGWNLGITGVAAEWQQGALAYPGTGDAGEGAGLAAVNLDGGRADLLLLSYDAPAGANSFRYNLSYNIDATGNATHYDYYKARFFNPARSGIYHYAIFAHDYWLGGSSSGNSFTNRDFVVTLGSWWNQTGTDTDQSGAFTHELGHNLGLGHGGNSGVNYKPNYPSIMNYANTYSVDIDYDGGIDGALDYSHGFLGALDEVRLDEALGTATFVTTEGVGDAGQGADLAFWDLDRNGVQDMLLMAYDAPAGTNSVRYKIGYDLTERAVPRRWTNGFASLPGVGEEGQGLGVDLHDINGNGSPELIVLIHDNPPGANSLRYLIGWDVNNRGETSNWSRLFQVSGVGDEGQGAAVRLAQIDADPRPDMIVLVYDNPPGANSFRYKIGWNLSPSGTVTSWSGIVQVPGAGDAGQGAGLAIGNLDADPHADPRPEFLVMAYDNPSGFNSFRVRMGLNVGTTGIAASWTNYGELSGVGTDASGAGIGLVNVDGDARPEMLLMAYDDPPGANTFRFTVGRNITNPWSLGEPYGFPWDFDGNGSVGGTTSANVNRDLDDTGKPILGILTDWNDWANLVF